MKYFIVLILLASLVGLAGCFEKKSEDISETDTQQSSEDNTQDEAMRDVDNTQEKQGEDEVSQGSSGSGSQEETQREEEEDSTGTGSQDSNEKTQQIIDESVSELEEILTQDIINEIFQDVK